MKRTKPKSFAGQTLKLGFQRYAVSEVESLQSLDGEPWLGSTTFGHGKIALESGMPSRAKMSVLMHEVVHTLIERGGHNQVMSDEQKEIICDLIGHGMIDVIAENPWIVELIYATSAGD